MGFQLHESHLEDANYINVLFCTHVYLIFHVDRNSNLAHYKWLKKETIIAAKLPLNYVQKKKITFYMQGYTGGKNRHNKTGKVILNVGVLEKQCGQCKKSKITHSNYPLYFCYWTSI